MVVCRAEMTGQNWHTSLRNIWITLTKTTKKYIYNMPSRLVYRQKASCKCRTYHPLLPTAKLPPRSTSWSSLSWYCVEKQFPYLTNLTSVNFNYYAWLKIEINLNLLPWEERKERKRYAWALDLHLHRATGLKIFDRLFAATEHRHWSIHSVVLHNHNVFTSLLLFSKLQATLATLYQNVERS